MKKKLYSIALTLTLVSAIFIVTSSSTTAMAATTKKTTATTKATPTPKPEEMVDGVKVNDLLTGKYNNISKITETRDTVTKSIISKTKVNTYYDKVVYTHYYDSKTYNSKVEEWRTVVDNKGNEKVIFNGNYTIEEPQKYSTTLEVELYPGAVRITTLESRKKELAKWKLDPSRFKTTSTKVTDEKITIKGTYTLTPPKVVTLKVAKKDGMKLVDINRDFAKLKFDYYFWNQIFLNENLMDRFPKLKCSITLAFDRETKQIISMKFAPKLSEDGYATDEWGDDLFTEYTSTYEFEHK